MPGAACHALLHVPGSRSPPAGVAAPAGSSQKQEKFSKSLAGPGRGSYAPGVSTSPPGQRAVLAVRAGARRRHRSHQRDRILEWLRGTDIHPTAAQIHGALAEDLPHLSLGTVYRNLEVLVAEGQVGEVLVAGGAARYDANLDPHHHFICSDCGDIVDVEIAVPRGLTGRLARDHGLSVDRVRMSFHGRCSACAEGAPEPQAKDS